MPSSPSLPCSALKTTSTLFLLIELNFLNLGSNDETLYPFLLRAFIQALPLSRLPPLSPEVPPSITKTFLIFFLFTNNFNL